jgi:hypothetical protein
MQENQLGVLLYMVKVVQFTVLQEREKHTEQPTLFVCTHNHALSSSGLISLKYWTLSDFNNI